MTKLRSNQKGFGLLVVLLVVVVVGAVAVVALRVVGNESNTNPTASTKSVSTALKSKADVKQAASSLDSTDVDASMNPDQLDSDLNSLL